MSRPRRPVVDPPWWWLWGIIALMVGLTVLLLVWTRDAHAGPNTRVFEALNETVNLTEWQYQQESGGTVDDSALTRNSIGRGLLAFPGAAGASTQVANAHFSGGVHNHARIYINPSNLNTTGGASALRTIIQFYTRGVATARLAIRIADLGTTFQVNVITIDDDFTGATTPIDTISANQQYRFDFYEKAAAEPGGIMRVYVDDALRFAADTLDTDGSKWDSLRVGILTPASSTNSGHIAFDDFVVDTMPCAPPCGIEPVKAEYGFPTGGF